MMKKKNNNIGMRLVFDGLILLSVFLLPWWCTFAVGAVLLLLSGSFEIILAGFLWDVLYGSPTELSFGTTYILTMTFIVCALLGVLLRSVIKVR